MIRKFIPPGLKRKIRIAQRSLSDRKNGVSKLFAQPAEREKFPSSSFEIVRLEQPIFFNPLSANKVANIRIAINEIERVLIEPGQLFSFWETVGNPTTEKGYKTGRNIIGDKLQEDIGGGLCQVSGMIYHLALIAGMEIAERYNHTLDLYEEDKRYTPLGADATVVFGYKDLRFKNIGNTPVFMQFEVSDTSFTGKLLTTQQLPQYAVRFKREEYETYRTIKTYRSLPDKQEEFINLSHYLI